MIYLARGVHLDVVVVVERVVVAEGSQDGRVGLLQEQHVLVEVDVRSVDVAADVHLDGACLRVKWPREERVEHRAVHVRLEVVRRRHPGVLGVVAAVGACMMTM